MKSSGTRPEFHTSRHVRSLGTVDRSVLFSFLRASNLLCRLSVFSCSHTVSPDSQMSLENSMLHSTTASYLALLPSRCSMTWLENSPGLSYTLQWGNCFLVPSNITLFRSRTPVSCSLTTGIASWYPPSKFQRYFVPRSGSQVLILPVLTRVFYKSLFVRGGLECIFYRFFTASQ